MPWLGSQKDAHKVLGDFPIFQVILSDAEVNMAIPTFASTNPSAAAENKLPSLTFSANPTQNRMQSLGLMKML